MPLCQQASSHVLHWCDQLVPCIHVWTHATSSSCCVYIQDGLSDLADVVSTESRIECLAVALPFFSIRRAQNRVMRRSLHQNCIVVLPEMLWDLKSNGITGVQLLFLIHSQVHLVCEYIQHRTELVGDS